MNSKALQKLIEKNRRDIAAVNTAISKGKEIFIQTFLGRLKLEHVTNDFWYIAEGKHFAGCNDGEWKDIKVQAGVEKPDRR